MTGADLILIGCSAGGFRALATILGGLPANLPAALAVCSHVAPDSGDGLATALAPRSVLPVVTAEDKEDFLGGRVHLAPPGYHLLLENAGQLALSVDPPVCGARPSIDVLFDSAVPWARRVVAVVLTGANSDGSQGLARLRAAGAWTLVQDPATAEAAAMPEAAIAAGAAARVVPVEGLAAALVAAVAGGS